MVKPHEESPWGNLNPRPLPYQGNALPAELQKHSLRKQMSIYKYCLFNFIDFEGGLVLEQFMIFTNKFLQEKYVHSINMRGSSRNR